VPNQQNRNTKCRVNEWQYAIKETPMALFQDNLGGNINTATNNRLEYLLAEF